MQLQDLLKQIISGQFNFEAGIQIFSSPSDCPLLFFTLLKDKIKQKTGNQIYSLNIYNLDAAALKSTLETSFLGQSNIYWLGDLTNLSDHDAKSWSKYFQSYSGPHTILFFANDTISHFQQLTQSNKAGSIKIDLNIDKNLYKELYNFFLNQNPDNIFVEKLFTINNLISLDSAVLLIYYQSLMGRKSEDFFAVWLDKIITNEKSLFTLSQHFFAKNQQAFFNLWLEVKEVYPDEFWIVYWSDQLWHAIFFVDYMKASMTKEARSINRLPFAFIQKDWKKCDSIELKNSHKFLYQLDYNQKNSAATHGLDLWLFKYFNNQFIN